MVTLVLSGAHSSVAPELSGSDSQRSITVALGQSITPTRLLLSPSSAISRHSTARALRHNLVDPRRSAASAFGFFPALSLSYARPVQCSAPVLGRRGVWLLRHWPSPGAPQVSAALAFSGAFWRSALALSSGALWRSPAPGAIRRSAALVLSHSVVPRSDRSPHIVRCFRR